MTNRLEDPAKCKVCGAFWDFGSTWLGQIVPIHPVTPCVPRAETWNVECGGCEATIRLASSPGRREIFWCSELCRLRILDERRKRDRLACRTYVKRIYKPKPRIPFVPQERICVECGKGFKPRSIYAAKQFLCGPGCQQARGNAKKKKAA
jgi:hypothetical protein